MRCSKISAHNILIWPQKYLLLVLPLLLLRRYLLFLISKYCVFKFYFYTEKDITLSIWQCQRKNCSKMEGFTVELIKS